MDHCTPREVWQEYEARKRAIDASVTYRMGEIHRQRDRDVEAVAQALGCGVPPALLTADQRHEQAYAIRRWRESVGCAG